MKAMPLPFDFEGKGVFELVTETSLLSPSSNPLVNFWNKESCFVGSEPTSVLETFRSPSPPASTSTLSSSLGFGSGGGGGRGNGGGGGGGSTDTAAVAAISGNSSQKWPPVQQETSSSNMGVDSVPPTLEIGGGGGTAGAEKCGLGIEDWEGELSETVAASPSQEQSILRWIMGDMEDPSMGLNRLLQTGCAQDLEFNGGFGVVDQGFGSDPVGAVASGGGNLMASVNLSLPTSGFSQGSNVFNNEKIGLAPNSSTLLNHKLPNPPNPMFSPLPSNLVPISLSSNAFNQPQQNPQQQPSFEFSEVKPQIFNPQVLINQHQAQHTQNPAFFLPLSYTQQEQHVVLPPPAKRHNPGGLEPNCSIPKVQFLDSGQELQPHGLSHQLQLMPHYLQQRPTMATKPKIAGDEMVHHQQQQQQAIIDQLYKAAAELVQSGNSVLVQGILARLNHQLSPIGKPFNRAAFYCKEALQLLLHNNNMTPLTMNSPHSSPFSFIFKIGAYKSFSEVSPFLQFANFTCNQALLEALEGFGRIHIVDFDIGYGGQWASFMQELTLKNGGAPSLKITAFASSSTHDQLELGLTQENLIHFASEINLAFEFESVSLDALNSASWSLPLHVSENEAIAVNLPVGSFSNYQLSLPLVLRFVKQLSPKIVVSVDRGCDRTDLPFPNHVIHALQSYSNLLESLDAVHVNLDALQKIERFLLQPGFEKIVMGRYQSPEKTLHWRNLFLSSGLSPLTFSNFTESQAECVVKRTPVRGFHIEKRQSSLVLCWQRKELISASAWRC